MERKPSAIHNSWPARDCRFTAFWLLPRSIAGYNAVPKQDDAWCTSKKKQASRLHTGPCSPTGLFPPTFFLSRSLPPLEGPTKTMK